MKTSIKIKKFWYSEIPADGGAGTLWKEITPGQREATVQFNGSDADTTPYKNVLGNILETVNVKGDKTLNFQFADLTPEEMAPFTGGVVTSDETSDTLEAPVNESQAIEKSIMFLTEKNVLWVIPRVSLDAYPMVNDDDLHYFTINSMVLAPFKVGVGSYKYHILKVTNAADITGFSLDAETGTATIDDGANTVEIEVETGTDVSALAPEVIVSLGAAVTPNSGDVVDFTSPVEYTVEAADGTTKVWTVTVTVAT